DSGSADLSRRRLACSWMQAKASSAWRALRPLSPVEADGGGRLRAGESVFGGAGAGPHAVPELFGVALIVSVKPAMVADPSFPRIYAHAMAGPYNTPMLYVTRDWTRSQYFSLEPRYLGAEVFMLETRPGLLE